MIRNVKKLFRNILRKSGRELTFYPLHQYLQDFKIDCVLDVGANVGQYANEIREYGYTGVIESFEPVSSSFKELRAVAINDSNWNVYSFGIGDLDTDLDINISKASSTSSFLQFEENSNVINKNMEYCDSEKVAIKKLDSIYQSLTKNKNNVFLKIDTQGYEQNVLCGACESLNNIIGVQVEVSLSKVYTGEAYIESIISSLREKGFVPYWIQQGYRDNERMQLMQADVFFFRGT